MCTAVNDKFSITYCSGYIYPLHGFDNSIITPFVFHLGKTSNHLH